MKQQPPPSYQVAMSGGTTSETQNESNVIATTVALPPEVPLSPPPYNAAADNGTETVANSDDNQIRTTNAVVAPPTTSVANTSANNQN